MEEDDVAAHSAVVLHEDKKYYPDADEVYPDAETLVQVHNSLSEKLFSSIRVYFVGVEHRHVEPDLMIMSTLL